MLKRLRASQASAGMTSATSAGSAGSAVFPSRSRLPLTVTGVTGVLVGAGSSLMCVVSLDPMASALGAWSVLIWAGTALIGGLQCLLLGELTSRYPTRAGGTPQYAYRAWPTGSTTLGALSAWCYWFAWTPGIAVNLILAAGYLHQVLLPGIPTLPLALGLGVVLYALVASGLRPVAAIGAVLAVIAVIVVLLVALAPLAHLGGFHWPLDATAGSQGMSLSSVAKWAFVAAWSSYGAEMASVVVAEVRSAPRQMGPVMVVSGVIGLLACTLVPVSLFLLVPGQVAGDPLGAFTAAAGDLLGPVGRTLAGFGLIAVLLLGALSFITGSSRTIYQLAEDRQLPRLFAHVNRRGAPTGSILLDAAVITTMLLIFGSNVVNVAAAANVGYLIVFVLLPLAYLTLRRRPGGEPGAFRLGRWGVPLAVFLAGFNLALLCYGGAQWGWVVMGTGLVLSGLILPIAWLSRYRGSRGNARQRPDPRPPTG